MTEPTEREAKKIFLEIVDLAPEERAAAIEARVGDRPGLRSRVEALLAYGGGDPKLASGQPLFSRGAAFEIGTQLGPYEITGVLGEGGFARVYRAKQTHPVRREVALKVLKPGVHGPSVIERFERERQALAVLNHPSVAKVFDADETADGVPYFVMELVEGLPITAFCDAAGFSIEERLGLMIEVCEAVHHAHVKGLIHRDIKPARRPHCSARHTGMLRMSKSSSDCCSVKSSSISA